MKRRYRRLIRLLILLRPELKALLMNGNRR